MQNCFLISYEALTHLQIKLYSLSNTHILSTKCIAITTCIIVYDGQNSDKNLSF